MIHRPFLAMSFAFAALFFPPVVSAQFQPSQRYPDPLVRIIDPSFTKYRLPLAKVEKIAGGMRWAEGPVWFGDGRYLLWSDIPNNRMMKWEEEPEPSAFSASRRTTPTATRATGTGGS